MTLEQLLKAAARRSGIPYETILKDYAIGHVLAALAAERSIGGTLVMKGGTALKKLYFGNYQKLRALLQNEERRETRRWIRPRGRDVYDLWRILTSPPVPIDRSALRRILAEKCAVRGVTYGTSADFFPEALINLVKQKWDDDLGALVADLPRVEDVLLVLRAEVTQLLGEA